MSDLDRWVGDFIVDETSQIKVKVVVMTFLSVFLDRSGDLYLK